MQNPLVLRDPLAANPFIQAKRRAAPMSVEYFAQVNHNVWALHLPKALLFMLNFMTLSSPNLVPLSMGIEINT